MQDILVGFVVPIVTALIAYFAASKKASIEMQQIKETNRLELEKIKIQTEHEIEKIQAQQIADAQAHQDKAVVDITTKQFENPVVQQMMGSVIGPLLEKEMKKVFDKK